MIYKSLEDFDEEFEDGRIPGWEDRGEGKYATEAEGQIDLEAFASVEELLTIGILLIKISLIKCFSSSIPSFPISMSLPSSYALTCKNL